MAWLGVVGTVASIASAVTSAGTSIYSAIAGHDAKHGGSVAPAPGQSEEQMRAEQLRRKRMGLKQTWATRGTDLGQAKTTGGALKSTLG